MEIKHLKPRQALNKAFHKLKPNRLEIDIFKKNIIQLLNRINEKESEEFHKNTIIDFLKGTYYEPNHYINTKGHTDLVIHNGTSASSSVGVIIETKKPSNKLEMLSLDRINVKALHELVLYYLRERYTNKNLEIKYLIATNIYEWFIFDATIFDKHFVQNKRFIKLFSDFEDGRLASKTTDFFYGEIAEPYIAELEHELEFTHFDIRNYEKPLRNKDKDDDNKLIVLFKLLSPHHLLKLPFANDSNTLDKQFYNELLHVVGLIEVDDGGKKIIERKKEGQRYPGAIIENVIVQLESLDKIARLDKPELFGSNFNERLFNVSLELSITWVNRILFLKLLEAQLISHQKGDKAYSFLNLKTIKSFDDLNGLFFQVLAKKPEERSSDIRSSSEKIPYLNSSLFEPTELEHATLFVSNLNDDKQLPLYSSTVLKDNLGKRKAGSLPTLEYLFEFLEAYDFASEGSEEIQEDNKTLINASVLGLIFEKINGYKDGSFFTPGFITMYMCRETIRRAIVKKFNEVKGWDCTSLDQLYDKIEDRNEANSIVNSLKICDPAVGSGHFLVSALNEIIAVKNDLRILQDRVGRRLKEYSIEVVNDELIVTDENDQIFEYNPKSKESQRVQEALFHEKQTIIENCLFGVDINPNSVKICRLRLWIELLKNAYYKNETELETLPNIDINIKCGNSLVSRFAIDADLRQIARSAKWNIFSYQNAVAAYKKSTDKHAKHEIEKFIKGIKESYIQTIQQRNQKLQKFYKLKREYDYKFPENGLFLNEPDNDYGGNLEAREREKQRLVDEINMILAELNAEKTYYELNNAFEWRFEFPEVMNENGDFTGFDLVMGNPPYIRQEHLRELKPHLQNHFEVFAGTADIYVYFIELGIRNLKPNGDFIFITPNKWMRAGYGKAIRKFLKSYRINSIVDFGDLPVFDEATTYPCILFGTKATPNASFKAVKVDTLDFAPDMDQHLLNLKVEVLLAELNDDGWTMADTRTQQLIKKLRSNGVPLGEYVKGKIYRGILTGLNEAFIINAAKRDELIAEDPRSEEIIKPFLDGRDIKRYRKPRHGRYLILIKSGDTKKWFGETSEATSWNRLKMKFPAICKHLEQYDNKARARTDMGQFWWELRPCDYYKEFETDKIVWAETSNENQFTIIDKGIYLNKTTFMMPTSNLVLLGIMNSSTVRFYLDSIVSKVRGGYFSLSKAYVETTPIPKVDKSSTRQITQLVNEILEKKNSDSPIDTSDLENQIDRIVYRLFELSDEEIAIVETKKKIQIELTTK